MKALVKSDKGVLLEERPVPSPQEGEVLLRVRQAGICNTDLEIAKGYMAYTGILGHEIVGEIVDTGPKTIVPSTLRDRRVVPEINCACRVCETCLAGSPNHCPNRTVLGIMGEDGGMAEFTTVPVDNLHPIPDLVSDELATFVEPLAAAMHSFDDAVLFAGARCVVLGDGKLGLLIAMALSSHRERLEQALVVGKHPDKLAIAAKFGLEVCLLDEFEDRDFDVVVEATGQASGLSLALDITRPRGRVILKSTYAPPTEGAGLDVDLSPVVINELKLVGSRCGAFAPAIEALRKGAIDPRPLISDRYALSDGEAAFARAATPGSLKVLLDPRQ